MLNRFIRRPLRPSRLEVAITAAAARQLAGFTDHFHRLEKKMSVLSDAITALTAAEQAEHEELVLVLNAVKDGQAKLQEAIDKLATSGFTAEDVAAVQAAKDQADANVKAMADALATPPPTT